MKRRASSSGKEVGKESGKERRQRGKMKKKKGKEDGTRVESVENGVSVRTVKLKNGLAG